MTWTTIFRSKKIFVATLLLFTAVLSACGQNRSANIERLFDALELKEGMTVADIGSREGFFSTRMAAIVGASGHVYAVDIDSGALDDLHANIERQGLTNITPVYSVPGNPMLPATVLDAVLIRNTYHEFTKPLRMLQHIRRSLKRGGHLVIAEPIADELQESDRERQARSHDISMSYVKADLAEAGFRILEELNQYSTNSRGDRLWLLIAE